MASSPTTEKQWVAFIGSQRIDTGPAARVALTVKRAVDAGERAPILVFDDEGRAVDIDARGSEHEVLARLGLDQDGTTPEPAPHRESPAPRGRGRPRLGVVAREVTLLPRHWEWLAQQPGGASAAVRRLIDAARVANVDRDRIRQAKESAYRFISAMAGNERGFEEATRALFAGDQARFAAMTKTWPRDVREHATLLASSVFD